MPATRVVVTSLILERPLCLSCIAAKATTTEDGAEDALTEIALVVQLRRHERERCRACGETGRAFSLDAHRP